MAGQLTKKHMINNAIEFVDSILSTNNNYYMLRLDIFPGLTNKIHHQQIHQLLQ